MLYSQLEEKHYPLCSHNHTIVKLLISQCYYLCRYISSQNYFLLETQNVQMGVEVKSNKALEQEHMSGKFYGYQ